jgi:DNA-binding NarL/FixJ family response regulator
VDRIRILLVAVPPLLGDILRCTSEPDVRVVGERHRLEALVEAVDDADANVVVFGTDEPGLPEASRVLLASRPRLKIIGISSDARRATLHELRPHSQWLGEMSPRQLLAAIRDLVDAPAGW